MKKLTLKLFKLANDYISFLNTRIKEIKVAGWMLVLCFMVMCLAVIVDARDRVFDIIVGITGICMFGNMKWMYFDSEEKWLKKIFKAETPRDAMREMTHRSYLCGLIVVVFQITIYYMYFIVCVEMILGVRIFVPLGIVYFVVFYGFSFIYFLYHIYTNENIKRLEFIRVRLQFYMAIGSSVSFLMGMLGENRIFKMCLSGIVLEWVWLQYLIVKEMYKLKEYDTVTDVK